MFEELYSLLCGLLDTGERRPGNKNDRGDETVVREMGADEEVCAAALLALTELLNRCEERYVPLKWEFLSLQFSAVKKILQVQFFSMSGCSQKIIVFVGPIFVALASNKN